MATRQSFHLSTLAVLLGAAPVMAAQPQGLRADHLERLRAQEGARAQASIEHLSARRGEFGLDAAAAFRTLRVHTDALGQTHTHMQQLYHGVKVWGGEAIAHLDKGGRHLPVTSALKAGIRLGTLPSLSREEALVLVDHDLAPTGPYASEPQAELVVYPVMAQVHARRGHDATAYEPRVVRYALAYHIHTDLKNGAAETRETDYMIDAHTGAILKKWASLETAAETGTGNSQYSGTVSITTNNTGSGYEMRDPNRGGTTVTDMANGTSGNGNLYTNATNTWGDGTNLYDGTGVDTFSVTGQTAAVDALFGFQATWDYYLNVHGRNGIDNAGTATTLRVHYDTSYDNAFWSDQCFCMTFGDGNSFKNLTAIDVIGHELSHGVCANNGNGGLTYSDESGGINEADSDINGTFVTYYGYNGSTGNTVPNAIPSGSLNGYTPWTIGAQLSNPPLRYMYHPSLDNSSPDYWYSGVGSLDVHLSSGPANRMMYFLAQGATASGDTSTSVNVAGNGVSDANFLPNGMAGVGNDHAARIWYRALTTYMNTGETYAQLRTDCLQAASDLYGASSLEYAAVQNAFHGINVGDPAPGN